MTEQLPLERLALWVEKRPDAAWLSQPVNGQWHDFIWAQVDEQARRMASVLHTLPSFYSAA